MSKQINKLANCNVYIDGSNYAGKASEVGLPEISQVMTETKGLGMFGKSELPVGIDKMEATFKWSSVFADVMATLADPRKAHLVQVRGNLETHSAAGLESEVPVVVELGGRFTKAKVGDFKQQEDVMPDSTMAVHYYKLVIDGQTIVEIDVLENIYKVDGVDILATYRKNLGL